MPSRRRSADKMRPAATRPRWRHQVGKSAGGEGRVTWFSCFSLPGLVGADGGVRLRDFRRIDGRGEPLLLAVVSGPVPETRTADPGRAVAADDLAGLVVLQHLVDEKVLRDRNVALHAENLGDV